MIGFPRSDYLDDEAVKATLLVAQAQDVLLAALEGREETDTSLWEGEIIGI